MDTHSVLKLYSNTVRYYRDPVARRIFRDFPWLSGSPKISKKMFKCFIEMGDTITLMSGYYYRRNPDDVIDEVLNSNRAEWDAMAVISTMRC